MTPNPSNERLSQEEPPIIKVISDFYSAAYSAQMSGDNPIGTTMILGGRAEVIGLNRKRQANLGDNVRFLVIGGSLNFGGFSMDVGAQTLEMKYWIMKLTLSPDDKRQIHELDPAQLNPVAVLFVDEDGKVSDGKDWIDEQETRTLLASLIDCELAPVLPAWAQERETEND
ncbi:MAG TPA: hypothetical protein VN778_02345 [Verrucomicrobiae bacterium]|nr:hypothetical protein [Verrucomicrobiae bacterium]